MRATPSWPVFQSEKALARKPAGASARGGPPPPPAAIRKGARATTVNRRPFIARPLPALLAGLAYAVLASAMPRAGGSYVYASRALSPYLGFVASFSQWFGLSIAIGVVSYLLIPFIRDVATAVQLPSVAARLDHGPTRLSLALLVLWTFVAVNLLGVKSYQRTLVPLMFLTLAGGAAVIVGGFAFNHADFVAALLARGQRPAADP